MVAATSGKKVAGQASATLPGEKRTGGAGIDSLDEDSHPKRDCPVVKRGLSEAVAIALFLMAGSTVGRQGACKRDPHLA